MTWLKKYWQWVVILVVVVAAIGLIVAKQIDDAGEAASGSSPGEAGSGALPGGLTTGGLPTLVDLGSDSCVPCQAMAPELEALAAEYQGSLTVAVIDVYENGSLAQYFAIQAIPTQIFLDETGKELARHLGFMSKIDMLAQWSALGYELQPTDDGAS